MSSVFHITVPATAFNASLALDVAVGNTFLAAQIKFVPSLVKNFPELLVFVGSSSRTGIGSQVTVTPLVFKYLPAFPVWLGRLDGIVRVDQLTAVPLVVKYFPELPV